MNPDVRSILADQPYVRGIGFNIGEVMVSKYQTLYQKITSNPEFQSFSSAAQLVFYTIKFCKENNAANLFEIYTETLSKRNNLTQKEVEKGLKELEEKEWIKREGELLWIVKGMKNNPSFTMNNTKHQKALLSCLNELPKMRIVFSFLNFYNLTDGVFQELYDTLSDTLSDTDSIPYANHIDVSVSVSEDVSVSEAVDINAKKTTPKKATTLPDDFVLSEDLKEFAIKQGMTEKTAEHEFEKFRNDRKSKGVTYKDWNAGFRTWAQNWVSYGSKQAGAQKTKSQSIDERNAETMKRWLEKKEKEEKNADK